MIRSKILNLEFFFKVGNTEIVNVRTFKLNLIQAPSSHHLDKSLLFREMTSLPILDDDINLEIS